MTLLAPCIKPIGPIPAKIAIVGEAPGAEEEKTGIPFIGASGQEMDRMLKEAGLSRSDCFLTNVLHTRPPQNKLEHFLVKKADLPSGYSLPPLQQGKYLHPDLQPEVGRLSDELERCKPNLILALGNTACWAVLGTYGISKFRGTVAPSRWGKVLPTYHPSAILRDWSLRPIVLADLFKARMESVTPEIVRPPRRLLIFPTIQEIRDYIEEKLLRCKLISIDIETEAGQISCIGFAPDPTEAIVIPFIDRRAASKSYWTVDEEVIIRKMLFRVTACPIPKLFQNGMYDVQYMRRERFPLCNVLEDTLILHHALYPELPKSLAFLGSIYTNETAWKQLRPRGEQLKRED